MDNLAKETAKKWNLNTKNIIGLGQQKSVPKFEISISIKKWMCLFYLSLHNQPPYMKKYSQFILSQIFWTKENKD